MRVAILHNRYLQRGGEDRVVDVEAELLRKAGHEVHLFEVDNRDEIVDARFGAIRTAFRARFNREMYRRVTAFVARHAIDVGHVHNYFPVLSPAAHAALRAAGVPVVQTLHNYRLLCANGLFLREGRVCEDCVPRGPWNAVRHGCYRGSRLQTLVWADATAHHRRRGTLVNDVDLFTVPSGFARRKLLAAGIPEERLRVKPNPVADPGEPAFGGSGAVFVGRLSEEKGVHLLLEAWREMRGVPLRIVGGGPDERALRVRAANLPQVEFLGEIDSERVNDVLRKAAFLVAPSIWYENFPMVLGEAMALGVPAVVPSPTALSDLVEAGRTGVHFARGDVRSLRNACRGMVSSPDVVMAMGREARAYYEDELAPDRCVERLIDLYEEAQRLRAPVADPSPSDS